jgi:hypothetical protein
MFQFDADIKSIDSGVWADYMESKFLLAHTTNIKFQRTLARLQQPHRRKIDANQLDPQVSKDILCRAMAEAIVLDWQHVIDRKGEETSYTPDLGYVALSKNADFRDFVSDFATNLTNYRDEEVEELGKS